MAWNRATEAEITDLKTGKKEVVLVKEWAKQHGLSPDSCYSASKRNTNHKGYHFKWLRVVDVDAEYVSDTQRKQIANLYRSGLTINELKERYHLGRRRITNILHESGIVTKDRARPEAKVKWADREIDDLGKFRALVNAGWHPANIADEFSTSVEKVEEKKRELNL